ncbi:MAG: DnaB-like helicase N-terminal domain-containing protein [Vicinamibacterales bacterium]
MADDPAERVSPHDLAAERAVLGAVLIDGDVYATASAIVEPETYYRRAHGEIWRAIVALRTRGEPADLVTVCGELGRAGLLEDVGGPAYVAALIDGVPRATNVEYYARTVRDMAALRAIDAEAAAIVAQVHAGDDPAEIVETAAARLDGIRTRLAGGGLTSRRAVALTPASTMSIAAVRYLWSPMMSLGAFGLLGGREGIGKTILAYTLAALVTRGQLVGDLQGYPRAVIISATEDSWEHTIVPRLMAAGADLALVYRVDVRLASGADGTLSLPLDVAELRRVIDEVGAALVILDPLLSRLDAALDSHKDASARLALEPLARLASDTGACVLGLIHVNKSTSNDPLTMLMASRAFAAVARFVLFAMADPNDEGRRLLGLAKNNLGRSDVPTLSYRIVGHLVGHSETGDVWTGKLEWLGESDQSIRDAVSSATDTGDRTATAEAADWLVDFLGDNGGAADSAEVKRAGAKAGHSADALKRARQRLRITALSVGFPRRTVWKLSEQQSEQPAHQSPPTAPTAPTGDISKELTNYSVGAVGAVGAVGGDVKAAAPTGREDCDAHRV